MIHRYHMVCIWLACGSNTTSAVRVIYNGWLSAYIFLLLVLALASILSIPFLLELFHPYKMHVTQQIFPVLRYKIATQSLAHWPMLQISYILILMDHGDINRWPRYISYLVYILCLLSFISTLIPIISPAYAISISLLCIWIKSL